MVKKVFDLFAEDRDKEAYDLARKYDIFVAEIWEGDEIIGLQIEDDILYFEGV